MSNVAIHQFARIHGGRKAASRGYTITAAVACLAVLQGITAPAATAQSGGLDLGAGATFEHYSFSDADQIGVESLSLMTTPFGAGAWIASRLRLEVRGAFASGTLTDVNGNGFSLSGLTDTELRASFALLPGAFAMDVIGYLPTGTSGLSEEEGMVAGAVAADLLPLQVSQWGTAGAVAVAMTGSRRFGALGVGVTASYRASGEYEPFENASFTYQPGDERRIRVALDATLGRSSKLSLAVGARQFGEDAGNDQNLFQTGDRLEVVGTYSFPTGLRGAGALYGAVVSREGGTFLDQSDAVTPSQNLLLFGGLVRLPLGSHNITPRIDGRLFSPDEGPGAGYVVGGGAAMEIATGRATLVPNVGARIGKLEGSAGSDSNMTGFTLGLTVRFGSRNGVAR